MLKLTRFLTACLLIWTACAYGQVDTGTGASAGTGALLGPVNISSFLKVSPDIWWQNFLGSSTTSKLLMKSYRSWINKGKFKHFTVGPQTDGPILAGEHKFSQSILVREDLIVCSPFRWNYVGLYNPITNTFTNGPYVGYEQHRRANLTPDKKVVFAPSGMSGGYYFRVYDPDTNLIVATSSYYPLAVGLGCSLPSGNIFFPSYSVAATTTAVIFDVTTNNWRPSVTIPFGSFPRAVPDGRIVCTGYGVGTPVRAGVYDEKTNTFTSNSFEVTPSDRGLYLLGGCFINDSELVFLSVFSSHDTALLFNIKTGTFRYASATQSSYLPYGGYLAYTPAIPGYNVRIANAYNSDSIIRVFPSGRASLVATFSIAPDGHSNCVVTKDKIVIPPFGKDRFLYFPYTPYPGIDPNEFLLHPSLATRREN